MTRPELQKLGVGAYGVALLLIIIPLVDSVLGVWPLRVGEASWRFGAVGLFSRAVMTPLLGLLIALTAAVYLRHRRVARGLAVLAFAGAGIALLALGLFGFDALQTRTQIRPEAMGAFDTSAIVAVTKYLAGVAVAVLLGAGGWKASRGTGRDESRAPDRDRVLVSAEGPDEDRSRR